jgi:hypothetical protein
VKRHDQNDPDILETGTMHNLELERHHLNFLRDNFEATRKMLAEANRLKDRLKRRVAMARLNQARTWLREQTMLVETLIYGMPRKKLPKRRRLIS